MLTYLYSLISSRKSVKGQDVAEYALLIGFIALVVVLGALILGSEISEFFSDLGSEIGTWVIP
jgi:pilus assembly protein Flp/PilA